jgi:hypothetical protein
MADTADTADQKERETVPRRSCNVRDGSPWLRVFGREKYVHACKRVCDGDGDLMRLVPKPFRGRASRGVRLV